MKNLSHVWKYSRIERFALIVDGFIFVISLSTIIFAIIDIVTLILAVFTVKIKQWIALDKSRRLALCLSGWLARPEQTNEYIKKPKRLNQGWWFQTNQTWN